jgi:hypothetical protein
MTGVFFFETRFVGLQYSVFTFEPQNLPDRTSFHFSRCQRRSDAPAFPRLLMPCAFLHFATIWDALALGHTATDFLTFCAQ